MTSDMRNGHEVVELQGGTSTMGSVARYSDWDYPVGLASSREGRDDYPVVHVSHEDEFTRGDEPRLAQPQFRVPRIVIKGCSHLCADTYCLRYRPAARRPQMIDTGMSHVGSRCAWTLDTPKEQK